MRALVVVFMLAGCSPSIGNELIEYNSGANPRRSPAIEVRLPPPEAYVRAEDQERARRMDLHDLPCTFTTKDNGYEVVQSLPTDQCYRMLGRQRYQGLWRNDFEGSMFCAAPAQECSYETPGETIWLSIAEHLPQSHQLGRGGLYSVSFEGRRTAYRGMYGHLGMSGHEIIVDRMISMRELEPPPPEPTAAQIREEWRRCEAAGTCRKAENFEELLEERK